MKEYDISGFFKLDNHQVIVAETEKEAMKYAKMYFTRLLKDILSDSDNLNLKINSVTEMTDEDILDCVENGILLEKEPAVKKAQKRVDKQKALDEKQKVKAQKKLDKQVTKQVPVEKEVKKRGRKKHES